MHKSPKVQNDPQHASYRIQRLIIQFEDGLGEYPVSVILSL